MKKIILVRLILLFCSIAQAQTNSNNLYFNSFINAIAKAPDGATYVGGDFNFVGIYSGSGAKLTTNTGSYNINDLKVEGGGINAVVSIPSTLGGGWYIGGAFSSVGGIARKCLAKINIDGSLNSSFNPNIYGPYPCIYTLVLDSTGNLYVGGRYTTINMEPHNCLAKINADGSINSSYNPDIKLSYGSNPFVSTLVLDPSGDFYVGGYFNTVGGMACNNLVKINTDGSLNGGFNPNINGKVNIIVQENSGNLIVGGEFNNVNGIFQNGLIKINADGSLVSNFNPNVDGPVYIIKLDASGNIYVGGMFTSVGGVNRNGIAKIYNDGSLNNSFNPNIVNSPGGNSRVYAITMDSSGSLYIGGWFSNFGGVNRNNLVKIDSNGLINDYFNPNIDGDVRTLALDSLGNLFTGGYFASLGIVARNGIAKINNDGSLNSSFNPNLGGNYPTASALKIDTSGNLYIGGKFTSVSGITRNRLAKINADGSLDDSFNPNVGGYVYALALDPSGNLYVGGWFAGVGSSLRNNLAKINTDGTLNTSFNPNMNDNVHALVTDPLGNLYVGGDFTTVFGYLSRNHLAKFSADGYLDSSFNPNMHATVLALALDSSNNLYAGGGFSFVGGVARNYLAKFNVDGSLNSSYNPSADGAVWSLGLDSSSNLYAGGFFTAVDGVTRNGLAKINADGSLNISFNPKINGPVQTLLLDSSSNLYAGGSFTKHYAVFNGVSLGNTFFDNDKDNATYYPNPTSGIININYSKEITSISVVNLLEQTVLTQTTSSMAAQLDLSSLTDGTYIVKMVSEGKTQTFKVLKGM